MAIKNSSVEPLATSWFMQDGTRPHQTNEVFSYILEYFDNHIIALNYPYFTEKGIQWPPCSIDLNLCDFFLWGHLKDANTSKNPEHLRNVKKKKKKHSVTNVQPFHRPLLTKWLLTSFFDYNMSLRLMVDISKIS